MSLWDRYVWDRNKSHQKIATSNGQQKSVDFTPDFVEMLQYQTAWGSPGAIFRQNLAVRTTVDFLARNIAQLNPKVYERRANADRVEQDNHPLARILRQPNARTTRYRHIYATVADRAIYDRAYWRKGFNRGALSSVTRIPPPALVWEPDKNRYRLISTSGEPEYLRRDDLVVFPGYDPVGDSDGVSPMETLRRLLAEDYEAVQYRERFWKNQARPSGWVSRPLEAGEMSAEAAERYIRRFESTYGGAQNAGKTPLFDEGMEYHQTGHSARESELVEYRKLTREEVAAAYGIPPSLIWEVNESKSNVEAYHRHLYQDVLGPLLRYLQDEMEMQLLREHYKTDNEEADRRLYIEFNLAEKLKGSHEELARTLVTSTGVPITTVNEARARLNLPRIENAGFDVPVMPQNVIYGGQPAVTIPTEDPSSPRLASRRKAVPSGVVRRRSEAAKEHVAEIRGFFAYQERAVVSKLGALKAVKANVSEVWDDEFWDDKLDSRLFPLAVKTSTDAGRRAASQLRGRYDQERTLSYLAKGSRVAAENINDTTRAALVAAVAGDGDVGAVFEDAKVNRSEVLGLGMATSRINFGRTEAAKHSSEDGRTRTKTWIVTSPRSRHPEMGGETVEVFEPFSNGMQYPGDPAGSTDEVANCQCLIDLA